ncbi:hypothetical protein SanaruYs_25230 [Chryseotalea sanaruensis]|uniref:Alpha/beta hydrolase n=1 Tax=Chryseotalea sanaruensis TaxID=2482724 RepID=A0A401UBL7_9BACT|nr:hypothetical protein [Chryseotalea sanaruensis]GCC52287.1 hypothetical protein SanaruYs_25230 [Chryseotalea sanaruensis]
MTSKKYCGYLFIIFISIISCTSSFVDEPTLYTKNYESVNIENGFNIFAPIVTTHTFEFEEVLDGATETFRGKNYYPTNNSGNLPLIIILHADGLQGDSEDYHLQYETLAVDLALSGFFVLSANRVKSNNYQDEHLAPHVIREYIAYLYEHYNNEIILDNLYTPPPLGQFSLIGKDVMFIGHSAGGRAILTYSKSTIESLEQSPLNLKALGLIAPTIPDDMPHQGNLPIFIVQGNQDTDGNDCNHFGSVVNPLSYKVSLLEEKTSAARAYILFKGYQFFHYIQNRNATIEVLKIVAKAFLKSQTQDLQNYIVLQEQSLTSLDAQLSDSYILYWRPNNILPNPTTHSAIGLSVLYGPSAQHLGIDNSITKSLNLANSYRITRGGILNVKNPSRSVTFSFTNPISVTGINYLHFRAGELVNQDIGELHSLVGIGGKVRLIYNEMIFGSGYATSEWVDLTTSIGNINSLDIPFCPRNSMRSYTIPVSIFNVVGNKNVLRVQFDFTGEIVEGQDRVYLNDIYFLQ